MSVLNSHRSAGNSLTVADRSMSVPSITVAPWASSAAIVSVEDRLDDRAHQRRVVGAGAPDADPLALERVIVEELRVVGEGVAGLIGGRGVVRIDAGRCAEEYRSVGHVAGDRAGRVLVGADRDDACAAPQPECRLDPDVAVGAGRADDRAVRLRADGRDREISSRDDAGAGARAARVAIEDVGHVRLATDAAPAARRRAGPEVGPLGQVGLADDDRAGGLQLLRDERVVGRAPGECPGAGCRRHAGGVDVVLDDDRNPEQRTVVAVASRRSAARASASAVGLTVITALSIGLSWRMRRR